MAVLVLGATQVLYMALLSTALWLLRPVRIPVGAFRRLHAAQRLILSCLAVAVLQTGWCAVFGFTVTAFGTALNVAVSALLWLLARHILEQYVAAAHRFVHTMLLRQTISADLAARTGRTPSS